MGKRESERPSEWKNGSISFPKMSEFIALPATALHLVVYRFGIEFVYFTRAIDTRSE